MDTDKKEKRKRLYSLLWTTAIVVLSVSLCAMLYFFVMDIRVFRSNRLLVPQHRLPDLLRMNASSTAQIVPTVASIQHWMTFDYVNKTFKIPKEYLQQKLLIQDTRYPNRSIRQYAQMHKLDATVFLEQVKSAIQVYSQPVPVTP